MGVDTSLYQQCMVIVLLCSVFFFKLQVMLSSAS